MPPGSGKGYLALHHLVISHSKRISRNNLEMSERWVRVGIPQRACAMDLTLETVGPAGQFCFDEERKKGSFSWGGKRNKHP